MRIELTGFNGHGWRVCDNCPCGGNECYFEYEQLSGYLNANSGIVVSEPQAEITQQAYSVAAGWYAVTMRPQRCIEEHGR